jgi:hypothetical protein
VKTLIERFSVKDSGFIVDLATGRSFTANPTGVAMFRCLIEGYTKDEIVRRIRKLFSVDEHSLRKDLDEFLLDLKVMRLQP